MEEITLDILNRLRRGTIITFTLDSFENGSERLWLVYNRQNGFILIREFDINNKRSFNHISFHDGLLDSTQEEILEIFLNAIEQIENGKCSNWISNSRFVINSACDLQHE